MAPSAPGILVACAFGSEDKAASDVLAALRAVDVGATRLPVSHRGLVFLRLIDDTAAADAHLSAHFAFASLVGAGTASAAPSLRSCQSLAPVAVACEDDAAAIRDAVAAACARAVRAARRDASGDDDDASRASRDHLLALALARPDATFAVSLNLRGDDDARARSAGPAPLAKAALLRAALEGVRDARRAASLLDPDAHLAAPDVVVCVSRWRAPTTGDDDAEDHLGSAEGSDVNNAMTCGVAVLPMAACAFRAKTGVAPKRPNREAPPKKATPSKKHRETIRETETSEETRGNEAPAPDPAQAQAPRYDGHSPLEESTPASPPPPWRREGRAPAKKAAKIKTKNGGGGGARREGDSAADEDGAKEKEMMSAKDADARLAAALDVRVRAGLLRIADGGVPARVPFPSEGSSKDAAAAAEAPKAAEAPAAGAPAAASDSTVRSYSASAIDAAVVAALRARVAFRLVHGTGDGFDGLTLDLIGGAFLLEQHRRWAPVAPLSDALRRRRFFADDGVTPPRVYLKKRWSRDPGERGGARVVQSFEGIEGAAPEEEPRGTETEAEDFFVPLYDEAFAIDDGERSGEGAASVYSRVFASNVDAKTFRSLCDAAFGASTNADVRAFLASKRAALVLAKTPRASDRSPGGGGVELSSRESSSSTKSSPISCAAWLTGEEHVGTFLDARAARDRVGALSANRRVLNLFAYTGLFGVAAKLGGATAAHNVDSKRTCLLAARANHALTFFTREEEKSSGEKKRWTRRTRRGGNDEVEEDSDEGDSGGEGSDTDTSAPLVDRFREFVDADGRTYQKADAVRFLRRVARRIAAGDDPGYDLIVSDPPPRFSNGSEWAFEAEAHAGRLLALCVGACAPPERGSLSGEPPATEREPRSNANDDAEAARKVLTRRSRRCDDTDDGRRPRPIVMHGVNALTVSDAAFRATIEEAERLSGRALRMRGWIGAGADFPACPYRPVARFAELEVGEHLIERRGEGDGEGDEGEGGGGRTGGLAEEMNARDEGGEETEEDEDAEEGGEAREDRDDASESARDDASKSARDDASESARNDASESARDDASKSARDDALTPTPPPTPPDQQFSPPPVAVDLDRSSFSCELCGQPHASRNAMFRHLSDPRTQCGAWCESQGGVSNATRRVRDGEVDQPTFERPSAATSRPSASKKKKKAIQKERSTVCSGKENAAGTRGNSGNEDSAADVNENENEADADADARAFPGEEEEEEEGEDASASASASTPPQNQNQEKKSGPGLRTKPRVVNPGELWVGGFAARDATVKSTAQLLWSLVPGAAKVAQPEIVALIRRGWRDKRTREWRAYAFARYRDEKEAETARRFLDGAVVSPGGDRVKAAPSTGATAGRPANGAGALTTTRRERRAIRRRARFLSDGPRASEDDPGGESSSSADKGLLPTSRHGLRGARDRTGTTAAALLPLRPGEDPPEREVFAAWPRRAVRRRAEAAGVPAPEAFAATRHASVVGTRADNFFPDAGAVGEKKKKKSRETYSAADRLWGPGRVPPRIVRVRGRTVPKALRDALLATLDATRWPSASHRKGVRAAEYLVLAAEINRAKDGGAKRSKRILKGVVSDENDTNDASEDPEDVRGTPSTSTGENRLDPFEDLKRAARAVMDWADPGFAYDHLAVTKDFVGSPHADVNDASHQYAMALGDWPRPGGELVVESEDGATRWVVDTRGRLARFDGRYVHWVRGFENRIAIGGEHEHHRKMTSTCRYSVVFYVNKPQNGTRRGAPVDVAWTPAGARGGGRGRAGAAFGRALGGLARVLGAVVVALGVGSRTRRGRASPRE